MALAGLLGAGARAAGGQLVKSTGKKIVASKVLNKKSGKRKDNDNEKNSEEIVERSSAITYQKNRINFNDFVGDVEETAPKTVKKTGGIGSQLRIIRTEVYSIEKILKKNLKKDEKYADRKRVLLEKRGRKDKETSREKPKSGKKGLALAKKLVPGGDIIDAIQKFIGNILLGKFVLFLIESFDKIAEFLKFIAPVTDFLTNTIGALFNGIVSVVEGAYSANEAIRKEIEAVGGEDALKEYDKFTDAFKKFANIAIILALTGIPGSIGPKGAKGLKGPFSKSGPAGAFSKSGKGLGGTSAIRQYTGRSGAAKLIERKLGNPAAKIYENAIKNGKTPAQAKAAVDKAIKSGKITPKAAGPGLGKGTGAAKGGIFKRGIGQSVSRAQTKIMGRGARLGINRAGARVASKISKFGGGRIPILGPLIVGISTFMETGKLDKALFLAGGSALGGFLGSFIPIPILGTILGTLLGEYVGDLFYILLKDGGVKGLGEKLKRDILQIIDVGTLVKDWILKGVGNIQNQDGGILGDIPIGIPFTDMKFKLGGWAEILNPIGDPFKFKKLKILKDSFFSESIATKTPAPVTTEEDGLNQWWDFLNLIPNSSSNNRGTGGGRRGPGAGGKVGNDLFSTISGGEGDIDSYNTGTAGSQAGYTPPKPISQMTVGEIMDAQRGNLHAVGKYQIIPSTMKDFVQSMGISRDDVFNEETQDKFKEYTVNYKRPSVGKFLTGAAGSSLEKAQLALAAEFASVGVPYDMKKGEYNGQYPIMDIKKGESLYKGIGNNVASISPEDIAEALRKEKKINLKPTPTPTITPQKPELEEPIVDLSTERMEDHPVVIEQKKSNDIVEATKLIDSIGKNKGTGKEIKVPNVGTFVSGKNFFGQGTDKYFDQSGNRITFDEFSEKLKSEYGTTISKPKLEPQLSPTPPKPLTNLQSSASYEDSNPEVMVAIQPIIIRQSSEMGDLFGGGSMYSTYG